MSIILATSSHIPEIIKINETCLPEHYPLETWNNLVSQNHSFVYIINNNVVGYCVATLIGEIYSFAVQEEHRNKGIGRLLLQHTLNNIYNFVKAVTLTVRKSNVGAQKLYKSMGFITFKIDKNCYIDGENVEDALCMMIVF